MPVRGDGRAAASIPEQKKAAMSKMKVPQPMLEVGSALNCLNVYTCSCYCIYILAEKMLCWMKKKNVVIIGILIFFAGRSRKAPRVVCTGCFTTITTSNLHSSFRSNRVRSQDWHGRGVAPFAIRRHW